VGHYIGGSPPDFISAVSFKEKNEMQAKSVLATATEIFEKSDVEFKLAFAQQDRRVGGTPENIIHSRNSK
jgi:hypothetical protein